MKTARERERERKREGDILRGGKNRERGKVVIVREMSPSLLIISRNTLKLLKVFKQLINFDKNLIRAASG